MDRKFSSLNDTDSQQKLQNGKIETKLDTSVTSIQDFDTAMNGTVHILEDEMNVSKLKHIKGLFKMMGKSFSQRVTTWVDENKLDILHHCIINNCYEGIEFLLTEVNCFPRTHMPNSNPYAHLAAVLNRTECLRQIMIYRPGDLFKSTKPNHVISLPDAIKSRVHFNENFRAGLSKNMKILLNNIKSGGAQKRTGSYDELWLEKEEKQEAQARNATAPKKIWSLTTDDKHRRGMLFPHDLPALEKEKSGRSQTLKYDSESDNGHLQLPRRTKGDCDKHLLTVYWNVFSNTAEGVLKNAGEHVTVKFSNASTAARSARLSKHTKKLSSRRGPMHFEENSTCPPAATKQPSQSTLEPLKQRSLPKFLEPLRKKKKKSLEIGVRGNRDYKSFQLKETKEHGRTGKKDSSAKYMHKTPLMLAAELGNLESVQLILEMTVLHRNPTISDTNPLTLATKARSPEAIAFLLDKKLSFEDYQDALMLAIREMYPECLAVLLTSKRQVNHELFNGVNLFHILYTQSLIANYQFGTMVEMTRILVEHREDVNAHNLPCTFPMYTLICCAFNVSSGRQLFFYIECLKLLLKARGNPHYNEADQTMKDIKNSISRPPYSSALKCIFDSAKNSIGYFENHYWSKLFMKKFILTIEAFDKTRRRVLNSVLFEYMDCVCDLGLDRTIVRALLRYGGDPDHEDCGRYAINLYFDKLLPFLTKFQVINSYSIYREELIDLAIVCRRMKTRCLREAQIIFLDQHLLNTPVQAVPVCRYFAYLINDLIIKPRRLFDITANLIWILVRHNVTRAKMLPLPYELLYHVIP